MTRVDEAVAELREFRRQLGVLRRAVRRGLHAIRGAPVLAAVIGAALLALAVDLASEESRRLDAVRRELGVATVLVGAEVRGLRNALGEMGSNPATVLAAANADGEFFSSRFEALRAAYPEARALHATDRAGRNVALLGDPALQGPLLNDVAPPICADGHGYSIVSTSIGRGLLSVAYAPHPALDRAREATEGRVRLSLLQRGTLDALAFTDVPPCARLPDVEAFALASIGEQGAGFVTRDRRTRAIAYGPLFGSDLALLVEEAVTPQPDEIVLVRAGIIGTAALLLLAYRAGQRSRKAPPAASAARGDRA